MLTQNTSCLHFNVRAVGVAVQVLTGLEQRPSESYSKDLR
jgi:hypothetical protein